MSTPTPIRLATRGSPLALAQTHEVLARCRSAFPDQPFEICVIRTTGDKLQRASLAQSPGALPKGLFTKELESALLAGEADMAVHSLKDLPTDVPAGLALAAVLEREDPRDVLICRQGAIVAGGHSEPGLHGVEMLPPAAVVATSSTRRREQLRALRPDLAVTEIRGNVGTRLQKLADQPDLAATLLALAGLRRLGYRLDAGGTIEGPASQPVPPGLVAAVLPVDLMIPCVGQAAIGLEIRHGDRRIESVCRALNHAVTLACVTAERAFLHCLGGGCQSPVAAYAAIADGTLEMRGISFRTGQAARATVRGSAAEAESLGRELAGRLHGDPPAH